MGVWGHGGYPADWRQGRGRHSNWRGYSSLLKQRRLCDGEAERTADHSLLRVWPAPPPHVKWQLLLIGSREEWGRLVLMVLEQGGRGSTACSARHSPLGCGHECLFRRVSAGSGSVSREVSWFPLQVPPG